MFFTPGDNEQSDFRFSRLRSRHEISDLKMRFHNICMFSVMNDHNDDNSTYTTAEPPIDPVSRLLDVNWTGDPIVGDSSVHGMVGGGTKMAYPPPVPGTIPLAEDKRVLLDVSNVRAIPKLLGTVAVQTDDITSPAEEGVEAGASIPKQARYDIDGGATWSGIDTNIADDTVGRIPLCGSAISVAVQTEEITAGSADGAGFAASSDDVADRRGADVGRTERSAQRLTTPGSTAGDENAVVVKDKMAPKKRTRDERSASTGGTNA